jgi:hypothetical protein
VFEENRKIAAALGVPPGLLAGWVYIGFVPIALAVVIDANWLGWSGAIVGVGLLLTGLRALSFPARPFDGGVGLMRSVLRTTRSVAVFYVVVSLWCIIFGVALAVS